MPQMAQHQAAELWELGRDHAVAGAKLRALASCCQDASLRHTLERHAGEFQQAAQRLMSFLQDQAPYGGQYGPGQAGTWQWQSPAAWQSPYQAQWQTGAAGGPSWQNPSYAHGTNQVFGAAGIQAQPLDIALASDCLRMCKTFAVQCIWGATECAEPARTYLHQLAGEHLRMAMDHYRWLEQHQVYASPRVDHQAVQEYGQKLSQLMQVGQAVAAQGLAPANPAFAAAGAGAAAQGPYAGTTGGYAAHQAGYQGVPGYQGTQPGGTQDTYTTPRTYARA
ncbi:hypothetical protein Tmar_2023 [Thermaerobacter marianensis DSM 12885]|uniref:Coat F domain protein n=1 Tax=Thermaerobacter marianensis (strain ATCC 700841 / DSM 12885 / JCM 10246 / 7p75a) TaxID=644966 RepID=E6SJE9_THEM7|nr:hypothetical protein [Thermaerobacter marianensis]ADU52104.1 hypothetical protein Tmar_2023 [Thermaerobacter marianensis DSM 12885]